MWGGWIPTVDQSKCWICYRQVVFRPWKMRSNVLQQGCKNGGGEQESPMKGDRCSGARFSGPDGVIQERHKARVQRKV